MAERQRRRVVAAKRGDADTGRTALDRGFDVWLNRQLHGLYDPILAEDVPDELNQLLDSFAERTPPPDSPDQDKN